MQLLKGIVTWFYNLWFYKYEFHFLCEFTTMHGTEVIKGSVFLQNP